MYIIEAIKGLLTVLLNKHLHVERAFRIKAASKITAETGSITIGKQFFMQTNVHISAVCGGNLIIKTNVNFNRNCIVVCRGSITIGNYVRIGPNVCVYDHDHYYDTEGSYSEYKTGSITIGDHCWIGAGAIILKDTIIGEGCVIGAGTIVKGTIPPHSLVTNDRKLIIKPIDDRSKAEYLKERSVE